VGDGDAAGGGIMGCCDPFDAAEELLTGVRCAKTGVTGEYGGRGGVPGREGSLGWASWVDCIVVGSWSYWRPEAGVAIVDCKCDVMRRSCLFAW
jgi:hypothetical protein